MSKLDEMVSGYIDGLGWGSPYYPASLDNESPAYKHGFRNGMNDRSGFTSENADVLRRRARMIIGN